jgi:D-3-phosphoglycerate dehydrogenase / 2-oxoglutarate reductase
MRGFANAQSTTSETAPRIVIVDEREVEVPPVDKLVVIRNDDRPGMIGLVGTDFGDAGVNISHYGLGHNGQGRAGSDSLATDGPTPDELVERLRGTDGIRAVAAVALG